MKGRRAFVSPGGHLPFESLFSPSLSCVVGSSQAEPANSVLGRRMPVARGISCVSDCVRRRPQGPSELGVTLRDARRGCPHGAWCGQWTGHLGVWLSHKPAPGRGASSARTSVLHLRCGDDPHFISYMSRKSMRGTWLVKLQVGVLFSLLLSVCFLSPFLVPPPGPSASLFIVTPVYTQCAPDSHSLIFPSTLQVGLMPQPYFLQTQP